MTTLIHDFTHQIKAELRLLNSNQQINSILKFAEQKTGLERDHIIYCNIKFLSIFIIILKFFVQIYVVFLVVI